MKPVPLTSNQNNYTYSNLVMILHAFGIAVFFLVWYFLPVSFALKSVNNLIVSQATFNGVDIG